MSDKPSASTLRLEHAKADAESARKRLASTMGALQLRLKPANLASEAWSGVKEKSGELADDAVQAVKDKPVAASGIFAALLLFFARKPIGHAITDYFKTDKDSDLVTATLAEDDDHYDLAAPQVSRSFSKEGVNA